MLSFKTPEGKFSYRVAGIAVKNNKILLNRLSRDPYWCLPGGRVEFNESSDTSLIREFREELDCQIEILGFKGIIENFFTMGDLKRHELGFYYDIDVKTDQEDGEFEGVEEDKELIFKWFSEDELNEIRFEPAILKDRLFNECDGVFRLTSE